MKEQHPSEDDWKGDGWLTRITAGATLISFLLFVAVLIWLDVTGKVPQATNP